MTIPLTHPLPLSAPLRPPPTPPTHHYSHGFEHKRQDQHNFISINKHSPCIDSRSRPRDRRLYNSLCCPLAQKRMDSRTNTSQSAFSRPLSQPALRDPRHAPIPPPPYTLQAPVRTTHPLNHDPFLPRRNDYEDAWQEQIKPPSQGPFSLGTYAASAPRDALATATENRERVQENSGNWRFADGRVDRYRSQSGDGKQPVLDYLCFLSLHVQSSVYLCSFALLLHVPRQPSLVRTTPLAHMHQYIGSTYLWVAATVGAVRSRADGHSPGSSYPAPSKWW